MQGGNPKKLECYCLLFTRKLFKPLTRDIQAAVTESPTQEGLEGSTAVNPVDQGWLEQTRMCQLKETGLQSVSVLNTIPKFTVNHSQKGKAGTDRLFQGCHSRSTTPAQPLHPSTTPPSQHSPLWNDHFLPEPQIGVEKYIKKKPCSSTLFHMTCTAPAAHYFGKLKQQQAGNNFITQLPRSKLPWQRMWRKEVLRASTEPDPQVT